MQRVCGLNSESKEGVVQAEMGGARPGVVRPAWNLFFNPDAKGRFMGV